MILWTFLESLSLYSKHKHRTNNHWWCIGDSEDCRKGGNTLDTQWDNTVVALVDMGSPDSNPHLLIP